MSDPAASGSRNPTFQSMTDAQLLQTIQQLTSAAGKQPQTPTPAPAPAPQVHPAYLTNIGRWSNSVTPPPTNGRTNPTRKGRSAKGSSLAPAPQPVASTSSYYATPAPPTQAPVPAPTPAPDARYPPRAHVPTATQALHTTYASRLRTGATLLMQPILTSASAAAVATRSTRRGGVINYADPGSGDEFPDAGALDSDDSDFVASGGTRTAVRSGRLSSRAPVGAGVFSAGGGTTIVQTTTSQSLPLQKEDLDQSYLGLVPPAKFITSKPAIPTRHVYPPLEMVEAQARKPISLVPIRVEFETETQRIRDCFVWNLHEELIEPEMFARTFCTDLDLPENPWVETVANQIRAQLEEHEGVASVDLGLDSLGLQPEQEIPECRVILSIDVQIATYHLLDHIEWDLLSPLTPETFAATLCADLGLSGEAIPLVAHAVHEELLKHKRDAIEWGVIGTETHTHRPDEPRDRSGFGLVKDKTGLGLGWGRAPKDGRGPKPLRSVWRDWQEAEEFRTRFEVLTAEEVERREVEKERASRRLRRETSKFQHQASARRRR